MPKLTREQIRTLVQQVVQTRTAEIDCDEMMRDVRHGVTISHS